LLILPYYHTAPVVFPVDFDGGEHVYRVHLIHVQLLTYPVIVSAKEEHKCDSVSESLDFSDGHYRVYRRHGERFMDQCVYESDCFGGGSVIVKPSVLELMVTLSSKLFKEH
jgi:hypothetical protein